MLGVAPISNVEARIGSIRQRIDPGAAQTFDAVYSAEVAAPPTPAGFEPFGETYQRAVDQAQSASIPASVGSSYLGRSQSFATRVGVEGGVVSAPASSFVATGAPGASIGRIGGFGPMPVPEELVPYGNGRLPAETMQPIGQGGHRLWGPAAQAWQAAVAAAKADGVDLRVTDSFRTFDQQVDLVARKGLYSDGGLGATPGTSNHGWGLAVDADVTSPQTLAWMRANGYRFGFVEAVPREPWHWEFRPQQA